IIWYVLNEKRRPKISFLPTMFLDQNQIVSRYDVRCHYESGHEMVTFLSAYLLSVESDSKIWARYMFFAEKIPLTSSHPIQMARFDNLESLGLKNIVHFVMVTTEM